MTESVISVTLTDSEFTIGSIQEFLDRARAVDEMPANAMITVTHDHDEPKQWTLTASTGFRQYYADEGQP